MKAAMKRVLAAAPRAMAVGRASTPPIAFCHWTIASRESCRAISSFLRACRAMICARLSSSRFVDASLKGCSDMCLTSGGIFTGKEHTSHGAKDLRIASDLLDEPEEKKVGCASYW